MKNQHILIIIISLFLLGFIGEQKDIWKAPEEAKKILNPTTNFEKSIINGKKLYKSRCAVCHGRTGLGDGPGGKALVPKPESLLTSLVQDQTDGEIFWKISNGRNDMIKWEPILTEQERWDLVNYMRVMKK